MFRFFKKKPRSALDEINSLTVQMYRPYLVHNKDISDEKVLEIVQTVMRAFKQAAESKDESITGETLMNISAKFVKVYDLGGEDLFLEHLKYEISKYLDSGLRLDYL